MQTRCQQHKNRFELPQLCHICQRMDVEHKIVRRVVSELLSKGYTLNVNNGGETNELEEFTNQETELFAVMMETGGEFLLVRHNESTRDRWIHFVYGNDGWDVISDYVASLDPDIQPAIDYAKTFE